MTAAIDAGCRVARGNANRLPERALELSPSLLARPYPGQALRGRKPREDPDLAGHQKAQRVDRMPDPPDIGDDRDPLPLGNVFDADPEIFPGGAREAGADLVIQPDLIVFQRILHDRLENPFAILIGDAALGDDAHHVTGEMFDNLDHRFTPSADRALTCDPAREATRG